MAGAGHILLSLLLTYVLPSPESIVESSFSPAIYSSPNVQHHVSCSF